MKYTTTTKLVRALLFATILFQVTHTFAQVQTDGSMGAVQSLSGNMVIPNTLGTQAGTNLFHSFSVFNIRQGESVLFTSSFAGPTQNVISRVTGGTLSSIDGPLQCDIPNASLWLINPNGIALGKNASVSVDGSFHASTADYLVFEDGKRFSATAAVPSDPILSTANPAAFGFVGASPAPLTVDGSFVQVGQNGTLSLVAGDIGISGAVLYAPEGRVNLVSVGSSGEVTLPAGGDPNVGSFTTLGDISIDNGSFVTAGDLVNAGGTVYIRGDHFVLDASSIFNPTGGQDGGNVDISAMHDISVINGGRIGTGTASTGNAGNIKISAGGDLKVVDGSSIFSTTSGGTGNSGRIDITTANLEIARGARISTSTDLLSSGNAGQISVHAKDDISVVGGPQDFTTGIASNSFQSFGNAGNIELSANKLIMTGGAINSENPLSIGSAGAISIAVSDLQLSGGALVSASSNGDGPGGNLNVNALASATLTESSSVQASSGASGNGGSVSIKTPKLTLDHSSVSTAAFGSGNAGNIGISVQRLDMNSGAISSDASLTASGAAGTISISATDEISMTNSGTALDRSSISSSTFGDGNAGSILISTNKFTLNDSVVDTLTLGKQGSAGTITINANELSLQNGASIASDVGQDASGKGGSVEIDAANSLSISGTSPTLPGFNSGISTGTLGTGSGGRIAVRTKKLNIDGGTITATSALGNGDAGSITIEAGDILLTHMGNIQVATLGGGRGGLLNIKADTVTIDGSGPGEFRTGISSQAESSGAGGNIDLTAKQLQISNAGLITARSKGTGNAGMLTLNIADELLLTDASILTNAEQSAGGNINIQVGNQLYLQNSTISSSANGVTATDNGGNLDVHRPQFLILNKSSILARANGGNGGNISLAADYFIQSADSTINASSNRGLDGRIVIDSPQQVTGTIDVLELPQLDLSVLLRDRCAAAFEQQSSFTVERQVLLPPLGDVFISSPLPGMGTTSISTGNTCRLSSGKSECTKTPQQ